MSVLFKDTEFSLIHLVEEISKGKLALPDIQRPFVWDTTKVRDLFDSMYRGYPIGTLMLWETGAEPNTKKIGTDSPDDVTPLRLIVDGQQRLTSLFAVLTGSSVLTEKFQEKTIRIAFNPLTEKFEVADAAIQNDPEFISDITALWQTQNFFGFVNDYISRLREGESNDGLEPVDEGAIGERISRVKGLESFGFHVVELRDKADEEQVAEIFVRTNSEGVKLNQADFILTLMSVHWEEGRKNLELWCRSAVDPAVDGPSPKNLFIDPSPDQMLRVSVALAFRRARLSNVYGLLRGRDLETREISPELREQQFEQLSRAQEEVLSLTNWHEFLKCVSSAGFRNRRMITSNTALLYSYAIWLIGRRDFGLSTSEIRPVVARWFFMAHTTARYSSSPETTFESDLQRLDRIPRGDSDGFVKEINRIIESNFTSDYWEITLPNRLDNSSPKSPAMLAYLAALNLMGADLLFSSVPVADLVDAAANSPRSIERHHLFPKAYLSKMGITATSQVNAVGNMAYLDWAENSAISDEAPDKYLPVMSKLVPKEKFKRQIHWHALPVGWEQLGYDDFLEKRRELIAGVVREGFGVLLGDEDLTTEATISDLVTAGESQAVEFKSTARVNLHTGEKDPKIEHVIAKTVCGFLNSEGGTLVIGVDDDGDVLGIGTDLAIFEKKPDADGYELFLRNLLERDLTVPTAKTVRIQFDSVNSHLVCRVGIAASGKPVFVKAGKGAGEAIQEFWVRIGNSTQQLHGDDMLVYQQEHWG